jgi:guanylate cyclase, other
LPLTAWISLSALDWMAPELLRRESGNTPASDVYSFGIILYEIYSRKDPYHGEDDPRNVLRLVADKAVRKRPQPIPKNMPTEVQALMKDCLDDSVEKRPNCEELDVRVKRIEAEPEAVNNKTTISLFDIFPRHIAEALRDGQKVEAEHKDSVTIFFRYELSILLLLR